jgi:hypothetical protein
MRIALQDDRADDRDWIERYVSALHSEDQGRIAKQLRKKQLRNEKQFITAYGELIVARLLISAGFLPRYERQIRTSSGVVTPDWSIDERGTVSLQCVHRRMREDAR